MPMLFEDPAPQYVNDAGEIVAGGTLVFTDASTTLPKFVYSDRALGVSLGDTVELDSAGRSATAVWLADGLYNVELLDADDVQVWLREDVGVDASGETLPDPSAADEDDVLFSDGTAAYWGPARLVPAPTGVSGRYLGTDGETIQWTAFPEAVEYDEDELPGSFEQTNTASGGFTFGNIRVQWGTDTCPTAAATSSTKAVTFGTAFSGTPYSVQVTPTAGGVTSDTPAARCSAQALSANTTGFTASVFAGAENNGSGSTNITSTVAFTWLAIGPK